jgi:hypothetical protein
MGRDQVRRLDLNLLLAFEALIAERSMTAIRYSQIVKMRFLHSIQGRLIRYG